MSPGSLGRMALLLLFTPLCCWLLACALLFAFQRSFVFPGAGPWSAEPSMPGATLLRVPMPEHEAVALYRPAPEGARTLVFFHGNGSSVPQEVPFARRLAAEGFGVALVEYPGYGVPGAPSEKSLLLTARTVLEELVRRGVRPSDIVLVGHSLGTGVAAVMAAEGRGARLVLAAPYTSLVELGASLFAWMPVRLLLRDRFETKTLAPSLALPSLVVHGTKDEVIPVEHGREVARLLRTSLLEIEGGDHYPLEAAFEEIAAFARAR